MIARSLSPSRPIPFMDPLHESQGVPTRAVRWTPPSPDGPPAAPSAAGWMPRHLEGQCSASANDHGSSRPPDEPPAPRTPKAPVVSVRGGGPHVARTAMARYDGPHSLSVRSSATGRHYRFPERGATQVIDAADISLMRRIEDVTIL